MRRSEASNNLSKSLWNIVAIIVGPDSVWVGPAGHGGIIGGRAQVLGAERAVEGRREVMWQVYGGQGALRNPEKYKASKECQINHEDMVPASWKCFQFLPDVPDLLSLPRTLATTQPTWLHQRSECQPGASRRCGPRRLSRRRPPASRSAWALA